jgi:hypothetical protein
VTGSKHMILSVAIIGWLCSTTAYACGLDFTFRAYLDKRFWQPFAKYEDSIVKWEAARQIGTEGRPVPNKDPFVFAGFSTDPAHEALLKVRRAYANKSYDEARRGVAEAEKEPLSDGEMEELRLIDAKLDIRMAEQEAPGDRTLLTEARLKLEAFLKTSRITSWRSEAQGWLARVHYMLGEYSSAVKIYLDELTAENTVFSRVSLVNSLHMIFPYNGSSARLAEHLEDYFDKPSHALFVVYVVTNPVYSNGEERVATARVAQTVVNTLQNHSSLFDGTDMSDLLALALMRASIYMGDTRRALAYADKISPASRIAETSEFNWMVAACRFLQREYAEAEGPLLKIVQSKAATPRELRAATRGLLGVYQKLGRSVDQLHAAFLYEKVGDATASEPYGLDQYTMYLPAWEWLLDVPYLLDVELTDDQLREYLVRYGAQARQIKYPPYHSRNRTASDAVEYALAVRLARQEKYNEAAEIYRRLNARPRATRMELLADMHASASDTASPAREQLEAQYEYASFLEAHSTRVFFNDMIWKGFQTSTFLGGSGLESQGFTKKEMERLLKDERRVKDQQEERWRAYRIFTTIMGKSGYTELGKRAASKAIRCLDLINTDRFGRAEEINQARDTLLKWLREYRGQMKGRL